MDYDSCCGFGHGPVALPRCHNPLGPCGPPWPFAGRALGGALGPCGQGPCGPPGPLWSGPWWGPWAFVGRALVSSLGPCGLPWALVGQTLVGPPEPLSARLCARPLWAPLGPHGLGPNNAPSRDPQPPPGILRPMGIQDFTPPDIGLHIRDINHMIPLYSYRNLRK